MPVERLKLIDDTEIDLLHQNTLKLLDEMGMVFDDAAALAAFADAGARVDHGKQIVYFPPDVLMKLVSQAPSQYPLSGRTSAADCIMGGSELLTRPVVGCMYITDPNNHHRLATVEDAIKLAHLVDCLPEYTWNAAAIYPDDLAPAIRDIGYCRILLEASAKHFTISAYTPESLRWMVELGIVVAGDPEAFKRRPLFNIVLATTSPMKYSSNQVGWIVECGKAGIPAGIASTPLMGANGPITMAACAIQIHAENLAGVALSQVMNPGAPVYYCSRPTMLDMRTGNSLWGPIEMGMIDAINVLLARRCGLPSDVLSMRTDAKVMDEQAAFEKISNSLMPALAGVHSIAGGGMLEFVNAVSHEQIVIDADMLTMLRRVIAGVNLDQEHQALDLFKSVGHQGQFLGEDHTRRFHRTEFSHVQMPDRTSYTTWEKAGAKNIVQRAAEKSERLLQTNNPEHLRPEVVKELERIVINAERQLS
jgi:trimethylamine---corrinoid protein Co-methyltransferase